MATPQPIKIAILAMGGEGGGVLADWIVALGEDNGQIAQTTSVPGVAQRTGATIYYVELFARAAAQAAGAAPVLALMPLPGDVDVVLASELMEAGRAVQRGLVTPQRTTLIASTHRVYAVSEKMAMGDGRSSSAALLAQAKAAAQRFIGFDMAQAADESQSVISAVLFGALAGAGVLPFDRAQFEATIERGGVGVKSSLAAFAAAFERAAREVQAALGRPVAHVSQVSQVSQVAHAAHVAQTARAADAADAADSADPAHAAHAGPAPHEEVSAPDAPGAPGAPGLPAAIPAQQLPRAAHPQVQALLDAAGSSFSGATLNIVIEGLRRLVDYQDPAYAALYLERLGAVRAIAIASAQGADSTLLFQETARHLALWMSYEDTIRVADLKTRDSRFARVRGEVRAEAGQVLAINEYLHPRLQEIADTLPARFGRWLLASRLPRRLVERAACKGRVVQTSSLRGYMLLSAVAGLRRWRRATLRFGHEQARIEEWLADIRDAAATDLPLGTEIARCQRLVKGYGDTHERGLRNFATLRGTWTQGQRRVPANTLATLREAALADEQGLALRAAMQGLGLE